MAAALAARLSRFLVGCHPRRWRQRYADEMLDVLEQHRAGARTVLDLAFSTLDAHLDREWRDWSRLRRMARSAVPYALVATALTVFLGAMVGMAGWRDSHWSPDRASGVNALVFAPGRPILISATGFDINGLDTVWSIADPARPRALARFEGGTPTAISPDGRTVATQSFHDQPTLWDVADPARPVKVATLAGHGDDPLWGQAFSPDGRVLAVAYDTQLVLWDVSAQARPRRLASTALDAAPPSYNGFPGGIAFSPDGHTLASTTRHDQVVLWNVTDPARPVHLATLSGHTAQITAFAFGPGGRLLAAVGFDGAVTVFDLAGRGGAGLTAKVHAVPGAFDPADASGNTDTTYTLAFSADGHTLTAIVASNPADPARAAATQTVSRWSLTATGTAIPAGTVSRDSAPAGQLTVAPDGRFLARGAPPGGDAVSLSVLP